MSWHKFSCAARVSFAMPGAPVRMIGTAPKGVGVEGDGDGEARNGPFCSGVAAKTDADWGGGADEDIAAGREGLSTAVTSAVVRTRPPLSSLDSNVFILRPARSLISRARKIVTKFHNYSYEIVMSPVIVNSYKNGHNSYQIYIIENYKSQNTLV